MLLITFAFSASAQDRARPEEAKEMCEKAAAYITENGMDKARDAFQTKGGDWYDRDLYVFVFNAEGVTQAHGAKEALVGKSLINLRDVDGKEFVKAFVSTSDRGWVDYKWQNPVNNKVEEKTSYIIKTGQYFVGVGAYK